ncbi:hypothetical protein BDY24DRAFT_415744 [Mrakia frigida]|uniref:uncharacterized protein n=1 Tax=Mrakia frigida TaxID=29902 RepID=UPI003FCC11F6
MVIWKPIPRGIIPYNSTNTLALSVWGMGPSAEDLKIDDIKLTHDEVTISSIGYVAQTNPGWEKRDSL